MTSTMQLSYLIIVSFVVHSYVVRGSRACLTVYAFSQIVDRPMYWEMKFDAFFAQPHTNEDVDDDHKHSKDTNQGQNNEVAQNGATTSSENLLLDRA